MPSPNQDLPGQPIHTTRRTEGRHFYLTPDPRTVQILRYAYGLAVEASGIVPHAEMTMSNHRQGVFTDTNGNRSDFHCIYHGFVGRYVNRLLGRHSYFWDNRGPTSIVILTRDGAKLGPTSRTKKDVDQGLFAPPFVAFCDTHNLDPLDRVLLYDLLNPIIANLVEELAHYPGFMITPQDWGKTTTVTRPRDVDPGHKETVQYTPMPPPRWANRPIAEAKRFYMDLIHEAEAYYKKLRTQAGIKVFGRKKLLAQDPFQAPISKATESPFKPRFTGDPADVARASVAYAIFVKNSRHSSRHFRNGKRDTLFPAGTVQLRKLAGVRCRGVPLPEENPMP